jgi:methyl-accepting chemotaxis protein
MFNRLRIRTKLILFTSLVVVVSVSVTTFTALYFMKSDLTDQAARNLDARLALLADCLRVKSGSATEPFRIENDKLMIGSYAVNGNHEVVDKIKDIFGGTATIFMRDARVATNVMTKEGNRAVGTRLTGPAYDSVFVAGKPYRGEAPILGRAYFAAYDPIRDAKGDVIGVLYVGIPKAEFFSAYDHIALIVALVGLLLVGLITGAVFFSVTRATKPLTEGVRVANRLSEGDLTPEVDVARHDEIGELFASMKHMIGRWREAVGELTHIARDVSAASTQLSMGAEQISKGADIEAERTSQVASASVEMSQNINDIARNTANIATSATQTSQIAKEGESVVARSVDEVREIARVVERSGFIIQTLGERSAQIGTIIGVINEIADQTNLLALNAAIEAARAGEQGRGFAVVADEVRKLAERTANATREIGAMIRAMQEEVQNASLSMTGVTEKVDEGVRLSGEAGNALQKIIHATSALQEMVQQISTATVEMAEVSETITRDVEHIATASREVSTNSARTRQASVSLQAMSAQLETVAGSFRLE